MQPLHREPLCAWRSGTAAAAEEIAAALTGAASDDADAQVREEARAALWGGPAHFP